MSDGSEPTGGMNTPPAGLAAFAAAAPGPGAAPVERWNPPYCGDVGLEIRADGSWWHQGGRINRPELVRLFARVLRKDEDGRTYLVTPAEKVDIKVADAPFVGVEVRFEGDGAAQDLYVRTNLDDWVRIDAAHPLRFAAAPGGGLKPYVLVRGRLEARLTRASYLELVDLARDRDGSFGLQSGAKWWPIVPGTAADGA